MTKLISKIIYTGKIKLKTGLHIGGTNTALNIGGLDHSVIRNPITKVPYIPGSSLKGKLRSLVEISNGLSRDGKPSNNINDKAGALFGVAADKENKNGHPSRLIVRDAELDVKSLDFESANLTFYTEAKTEAAINRVTAIANPRTFERVPAGAKFKLNMVLNIFEGEDKEELKTTLHEAIKLLENDYLGGQGSRGYGQVEFEDIKEEEIEF